MRCAEVHTEQSAARRHLLHLDIRRRRNRLPDSHRVILQIRFVSGSRALRRIGFLGRRDLPGELRDMRRRETLYRHEAYAVVGLEKIGKKRAKTENGLANLKRIAGEELNGIRHLLRRGCRARGG